MHLLKISGLENRGLYKHFQKNVSYYNNPFSGASFNMRQDNINGGASAICVVSEVSDRATSISSTWTTAKPQYGQTCIYGSKTNVRLCLRTVHRLC